MRKLSAATIQERVAWALALVQLEGSASALPRQLSGGQQQRVALARAVVSSRRCSSWTSRLGALDRKLRIEMQLELKRLQARLGVTVIYVTHDQEEALTLSDRIAVMKGTDRAAGRAGGALREPAHRVRRPVHRRVKPARGHRARRASDGGAVLITPSGLRLPVRSGACRRASPLVLFLRPERIAIAPDGEAGGGAVTGDVVEAVFVGETMRYVVRTAGRRGVHRQAAQSGRDRSLQGRARVTLRWPPDAAFTQRRQP